MNAEAWPFGVPSATFLRVPEVDHLHATLRSDGFELAPQCRPRRRGIMLHVALVWRRPRGDAECVLRLRLRLPAPQSSEAVRD